MITRGQSRWLCVATILCLYIQTVSTVEEEYIADYDLIEPFPSTKPSQPVIYWLATLAIGNGLAAAARRDLEQATDLLIAGAWLKPDESRALISLAEVFQERGLYRHSYASWHLARLAVPADPYVVEGIARALDLMGEAKKSEEKLHTTVAMLRAGMTPPLGFEAASAQPLPPSTHTTLWLRGLAIQYGTQAFLEHNIAAATDLLSAASWLSPSRALEIPAQLHAARLEHSKAIRAWERASSSPSSLSSPLPLLGLAAAHLAAEDNHHAKLALLKAVKHFQNQTRGRDLESEQALARVCVAEEKKDDYLFQGWGAPWAKPMHMHTGLDSVESLDDDCLSAHLGLHTQFQEPVFKIADLQQVVVGIRERRFEAVNLTGVKLGLALADLMDNQGDTHAAWNQYQLTQGIWREQQLGGPLEFKGEEVAKHAMQVVSQFNSEWVKNVTDTTPTYSPLLSLSVPLFLTGMPRGGAALLSKVLRKFPQVDPMEDSRGDFLSKAKVQHPSPDSLSNLTKMEIRELGIQYMTHRQKLAPTKKGYAMFIDNELHNHWHGGLILAALPKAKILHMVRDPRDQCISAYKRVSAISHLQFTSSLSDCVQFAIMQLRLINHWRTLFPGRVHVVEYEKLTAHPEKYASEVMHAVGLEGSIAADELSFVHSNSVGKWRAYQNHVNSTFGNVHETFRALIDTL